MATKTAKFTDYRDKRNQSPAVISVTITENPINLSSYMFGRFRVTCMYGVAGGDESGMQAKGGTRSVLMFFE